MDLFGMEREKFGIFDGWLMPGKFEFQRNIVSIRGMGFVFLSNQLKGLYPSEAIRAGEM
ncbi:MAG: hypothetical protein FWD62_14595 [Betaproteobacteria bacterium]|nr:hypothetical protein [Betaproteobacteria bacterium]